MGGIHRPKPIDYTGKWRVISKFWRFLCCQLSMLLNKQSSCQWFELPWYTYDNNMVTRWFQSTSTVKSINTELHNTAVIHLLNGIHFMEFESCLCIPIRKHLMWSRADSRFVPNQWETVLLLGNNVCHWLGTSLDSVLYHILQTSLFNFHSYSTM